MRRYLSSGNSYKLLDKFKGAFLGQLVGDCCGSPYHNELLTPGDKKILQTSLKTLEGPMFDAPRKPYTNSTALTIPVAKCLIENKSLPSRELAKLMMQKYFENPRRGYSEISSNIFQRLQQTKLKDPLLAKNAFSGHGSFGNGAAARIAPVALYYYNEEPDVLYNNVKSSAIITHTHPIGINGAFLLALAINYCLTKTPNNFKTEHFIDHLLNHMKKTEQNTTYNIKGMGKEYENKLTEVKNLLSLPNPSEETVLNKLGHTSAAQYSIPTAIYGFLKYTNDPKLDNNTIFTQAIAYVISLGGATDTIASMTGCLLGVLHGDSIIPNNLIKHCESYEEIKKLSEELYASSR